MSRVWSTLALLCSAAILMMFGTSGPSQAAPPPTTSLPGLALTAYDASIGDPLVVDRLTVFPIYATSNPEFEDAISLEHALAKKKAKVREVGDKEGGDTVGALVIENKGTVPIFVLAGTVVKGGKQDRQIGQDFVIAANETVDVEAFCVEQGRWDQSRSGKNTGGKFSASGMLAPRKVRKAAQHDSDQGKVWDEVAKTNQKAKKRSGSGTLMATLDADDVKAERRKLSASAVKAIDGAPSQTQVLGVAYAIDGQVRGARWFASRQLWEQHRDKLLETAALEALLADTKDKPKKVAAKQVRDFVDNVGKSAVHSTKKRAKAVNTNLYKKSAKAGASEARVMKKKKKADGSTEELLSAPISVDVTGLE